MKRSIKTQMTAMFIGLVVCMLLALLALNAWLLEPYYIRNKKQVFVTVYAALKEAVSDGSIANTDRNSIFSRTAEKGNMSYLVIDSEDGNAYTNVRDKEILMQQLNGYLLNQMQKESKILSSTKDYQISRYRDPALQSEYLAMWGQLSDGYVFFVRSPVESIKESASLSNQLLICSGIIIILFGIALVWYFSKRLTDPILELAVLSARMANLDFEARYQSGGQNEIGVLGGNFNCMSKKLQDTVSELKNANYHLQKDIEKKEKLEQMRNDFLGNVSHELKTPIALIQGYAEGLKEGVNDDAQSREFYCDVIMDEAAKMNEMVKNLLTLNQLECGDEAVAFSRFNLTELIAGVLQSMEILVQQKEATVIFRQSEPVYVWADEFKVEQVVRNYVSNAFHHLAGDNVIEVKIGTAEDKAKVTVFNTGIPIPEEDIPRIWDKFYKVDKAHTRDYGGNGIGLSIVKAIMDSFGQQYGINNYDNGVEFWFCLDVK